MWNFVKFCKIIKYAKRKIYKFIHRFLAKTKIDFHENAKKYFSSLPQPRQASQPLGFFIYSIIAEPTISRDNYIRLAEMPGIFTGVVWQGKIWPAVGTILIHKLIALNLKISKIETSLLVVLKYWFRIPVSYIILKRGELIFV